MLKFFRLNVLLGSLVVIVSAMLLVGLGVAWGSKDRDSAGLLGFLQEPVVLTVLGAILTFLVIDRWRRLETDVSEIHQSQAGIFRDIREDARSLVRDTVDEAARKAQSLDERISALIEDHPWIPDVTENEFIPDASSCSVVLATARDLWAKGRKALVYEYIFSWTKRPPGKTGLEGTAHDFISLAAFCVDELADAYLAYLVMREGCRNSIGHELLLPEYLRLVSRLGSSEESRSIADRLRSVVFPSTIERLLRTLRGRPTHRRAELEFDAAAALALYEANYGDGKKIAALLEICRTRATGVNSEDEEALLRAELAVAAGDYAQAERELLALPRHIGEVVLKRLIPIRLDHYRSAAKLAGEKQTKSDPDERSAADISSAKAARDIEPESVDPTPSTGVTEPARRSRLPHPPEREEDHPTPSVR